MRPEDWQPDTTDDWNMNRRTFLDSVAVIGGTAVAGCTGTSQKRALRRADESAVKMSATTEHSSESVYKGSGHLETGEFAKMNFWSKIEFTFEWELHVTNGDPIDVWVLPQKEFKPFRNQGDVSYFHDVSKMAVTSGKASGTIRPGKHMIIWENSKAYETVPNGAVDFDAIVHMTY